MNYTERKQIFIEAVQLFRERNGEMTLRELEPLVINLACVEAMKSDSDVLEQMEIGESFGKIAQELFGPAYGDVSAANVPMSVMTNVQWDGMKDFLEQYFSSNLGINLSNEKKSIEEFSSSSHTRFENGNRTAHSEVARLVSLQLSENNNKMVVSIMNPNNEGQWIQGLSPKVSHLVKEEGNHKFYRGSDEDYLFEVIYDDFGSIEQFILNLQKGHVLVRIVYNE